MVIITTNRSPWDWYVYNDRDWEREALFRRFTGCYKFEKNAEGVPRPVEVDINDRASFARPIPIQQALRGTTLVVPNPKRKAPQVCLKCMHFPCICKQKKAKPDLPCQMCYMKPCNCEQIDAFDAEIVDVINQ